jgi:crotonobetainyl-CoA:carnitine CoA-transferase CaiB-like acyl-CoA transferase
MTPIHGVRVLEIASFITGPYAAMLLGDLGADVVKIEHPKGGDPFRTWSRGNYSPQYRAYNRGKRSLTLDLKSPKGIEVLHDLLAKADVLIENFRPGTAERLGFGYEALAERYPKLIYCSVTGFGKTGPYRSRPSYDTVGQGYSGLLRLLMDADNPRPVGPAFSDCITGVFACYGILGALLARERSGLGQKVELSMLSATLSFLIEPAVAYLSAGEVNNCFTRPRVSQVYAAACEDGKLLAIHLSSPPKFWASLTEAIAMTELRQDPRFANREKRIANYESLAAILGDVLKQKPRAHWLEKFERFDVPCTPIYDMSEVFADPQVKHAGLEIEYSHSQEGVTRSVRPAVSFSRTELEKAAPPPALGEHSKGILLELGYESDRIRSLQDEGVI